MEGRQEDALLVRNKHEGDQIVKLRMDRDAGIWPAPGTRTALDAEAKFMLVIWLQNGKSERGYFTTPEGAQASFRQCWADLESLKYAQLKTRSGRSWVLVKRLHGTAPKNYNMVTDTTLPKHRPTVDSPNWK